MYTSKKVCGHVDWVGVLDPGLRVFDVVVRTEEGTTYNSYVVKGAEKTAVIDIVKDGFFDEFLERLRTVADPADISYIIVNHSEPDHSGSLFRLLSLCPGAQVVGTAGALNFLGQIVNHDFAKITAKEGMALDLGGATLKFFPLPFLHWPDTMFTYLEEDGALFTCDAFGCHFCDENIFSDLITRDFLPAYKYYFDNIMAPFKPYVLKALDKAEALKPSAVCTGHGPALRADIQKYFDLYREWATERKSARPLTTICYVSAYGYTRQLAEKLAEGVRAAGDMDVRLFDLVQGLEEDAAINSITASDGVMFGTPTIVGDALPPIYGLLTRLNPQIHGGRLALAFGSYGWSGEGVKYILSRMEQLRFNMPFEPLRVQFKPAQRDLDRAFELGRRFGAEIIEKF